METGLGRVASVVSSHGLYPHVTSQTLGTLPSRRQEATLLHNIVLAIGYWVITDLISQDEGPAL